LADSYSREKQSEAEKIKFNRDMNSSSDNVNTAQNAIVTALSGAAAGALIGSSVPVIGTIVGFVVGALGGIIATEVAGAQSRAEQEATNKVIMYVQEHGNDIFGAKNAQDFGDMLAK
jgi:outer membrane lipoprotein SlyB